MDIQGYKVFQMLKPLYAEVWTLFEWLRSLGADDVGNPLLRPTDSLRYHNFLTSSLICLPVAPVGINLRRDGNEIDDHSPLMMKELIHRVIEKLLRRSSSCKSNLLTKGFGMISEKVGTRSNFSSIELQYPNSNFSEINRSHWQTLHSRIGEKLMTFILEKTSIFVFIAPSSWCQITGTPVFDLPNFKLDAQGKNNEKSIHFSGKVTRCKNDTKIINSKSYSKLVIKKNQQLSRKKKPRNLTIQQSFISKSREQNGNSSPVPKKHSSCVTQKIDKTNINRCEVKEKSSPAMKRTFCDEEFAATSKRPKVLEQPIWPTWPLTAVRSETSIKGTQRTDTGKKRRRESDDELNTAKKIRVEETITQKAFSSAAKRSAITEETICQEGLNKKKTRRGKRRQKSNTLPVLGRLDSLGRTVIMAKLLYNRNLTEKWPTKGDLPSTGDKSNDVRSLFRKIFADLIGKEQLRQRSCQRSTSQDLPYGERKTKANLQGLRSCKLLSQKSSNKNASNVDVIAKQATVSLKTNSDFEKCCPEIQQKSLEGKSKTGSCETDLRQTEMTDVVVVQNNGEVVHEDSNSTFTKLKIRKKFPRDNKLQKCSTSKLNLFSVTSHVIQEASMAADSETRFEISRNPHNIGSSQSEKTSGNQALKCGKGKIVCENETRSHQSFFTAGSSQCLNTSENSLLSDSSKSKPGSESKSDGHPSFFDATSSGENRDTNILLQEYGIFFGKKTNLYQPISKKLTEDALPPGVEDVKQQGETSEDDCDILQGCPVMNAVYKEVKPLLTKIIEKHRLFPYKHFLNKYCPVKKIESSKFSRGERSNAPKLQAPVYTRNNGKKASVIAVKSRRKIVSQFKSQAETCKLLEDFVPLRQVFLFLRQVCLRVLSREIIGVCNWNALMVKLKWLLSMQRFDKLSLKHLIMNIKVSLVPWLKGVTNHSDRSSILASLIWWIFTEYITVILKSFFYVTDSTLYRNQLFFYRKSVWHKLKSKATSDFLNCGMLKPTSEAEVKNSLKQGNSLGVSQLRFLPKTKSLRPIVNMGDKSVIKALGIPGKKYPINVQLSDVFKVMSHFKVCQPSILGSSVFGVDDIYRKWHQFVHQRRSRLDNRQLYFVSLDIKNCYDSIRQDKLYHIVKDVIRMMYAGEYIIRKFVKVTSFRGAVKKEFCKIVTSLENYESDSLKFFANLVKEEKITDALFVDQVFYDHVSDEDILKKLHAHIFNNIIKVGSKFYHQKVGISQGSIVSSLLCNLYSAHLESRVISPKTEELLMRMVDDWLFVTPHYSRATNFLVTMTAGFSEYNYLINPEKTLTNFPAQVGGQQVNHFDICHDCLPWCGLLFDTQSLTVAIDYGRYSGVSMSSTLTVDTSRKPGETLKRKMFFSILPRCHPLYVDTTFNTDDAIFKNVYQIFLLLAFKFHASVKKLASNQRANHNPEFFFGVILSCADFFHKQTAKKMNKLRSDNVWPGCLSILCIKWLCVLAFITKLTNHQSEYHFLLKKLRKSKTGLFKTMDKDVKEAVTNITKNPNFLQPAEFEKILT